MINAVAQLQLAGGEDPGPGAGQKRNNRKVEQK